MKYVKDIPHFKNVKEIRTFDFGTFYFFDYFFVSEINEGVVFNWEMGQDVIKAAYEILGHQKPVAYISNRINSYSLVPTDWIKFYNQHKDALSSYAIVGYSANALTNVFLEKMFSKTQVRKFVSLEDAIEWSLSVKFPYKEQRV